MTEADSHLQARVESCKNLQKVLQTLYRVLARQTRGEQGHAQARIPGSRKKFPRKSIRGGKIAWVQASRCESLPALQGGMLFVVEVLTTQFRPSSAASRQNTQAATLFSCCAALRLFRRHPNTMGSCVVTDCALDPILKVETQRKGWK